MAGCSVELKLARHLAAPFTPPGQVNKPLSFRLLEDGGMVVISADGRKLWFTLAEVNQARGALGLPELPSRAPAVCALQEQPGPNRVTSRPPAGTRDGVSEMIILPPELKHLEKKIHDKTGRH